MMNTGEISGEYTLVRHLGSGAGSEVWLAEHRRDRAKIALKFTSNIDKEVRQLSNLQHPSLIAFYGHFWDADHGKSVIMLEWVDGDTIDKHAASLDGAQRLWILRHLAHVLAYLHGMQRVHRDVKPENVIIARRFYEAPVGAENVRLIDFDISARARSQLTRHGGLADGTVPYMPPEVLGGDDGESENKPERDVFAFGVLAWQLLAGHHPCGSLSATGDRRDFFDEYELVKKGHRPYPQGQVPGEIGNMLKRCLSVRVWERPSMAEVAEAFNAATAPSSVPSRRRNERGPEGYAQAARHTLLGAQATIHGPPAWRAEAEHLARRRSPVQRESIRRRSKSRSVALLMLAVGCTAALGAAALGWFYVVPSPARGLGLDGTPGAYNDGSDVTRPILAPDDEGFVDTRGGWGWGDRCWIHIHSGKWGWAKAECDQGMAMNPAAPLPRASLLYNLGLIEKHAGNMDLARRYFEKSLALREHPEVRAALESLR